MKHAALVISALLILAPASAIVNYTGPTDAPHIMSGGDQDFRVVNASCSTQRNDTVEIVNRTGTENGWTAKLRGAVQEPNPCFRLEPEEIDTDGNVYVLDVKSVDMNGSCVDCLGSVDYSAAVDVPGDKRLEVRHDGETVETFKAPGKESRGFLATLFQWFSGLF